MSEGTTRVAETAGKVAETADDFASKAQKFAEDTADQGRRGLHAVAQASDAIQGIAQDVGNQASQAVNAVYEQGARAKGYVSQYATEQPLAALLIAGAIGYGIAYLIHRH
jgi:methyl-accepting chemotaxis protein